MQDAAGDFEVYKYNPSENAFDGSSMGAVGPAWTVVGIAADPPGGRRASGSSTAQFVQAMASMGISAASTSAPVSVLAAPEQSQQTLLAAPHA